MPHETEITESWKEKIYEPMLTKYYFGTLQHLRRASDMPVLQNMRSAFNHVRSLCCGMILSPYHMREYKKEVKPVIADMEAILFGNRQSLAVMKKMAKYGVTIDVDRHGISKVMNAQHIMSELWEIFTFMKQWAYEQGFFAIKPYSRKVGVEALEDAFTQ